MTEDVPSREARPVHDAARLVVVVVVQLSWMEWPRLMRLQGRGAAGMVDDAGVCGPKGRGERGERGGDVPIAVEVWNQPINNQTTVPTVTER